MKNKELIAQLQQMDPEAEVITDFWNGHVNSYTAIDYAKEWDYKEIEADFFGTPGAVDLNVFCARTEKVVFIGSNFADINERVFYARRVLWRIQSILRRHRPLKWKKDRVYQELKSLDEDAERSWFDNVFLAPPRSIQKDE